MAQILKGDVEKAKGTRIAILVSRFNELITKRLLDGALTECKQLGLADEHITVLWVPGAFELPGAAMLMARKGGVDAVVALGAVIRGETSHYDFVAGESARGIRKVGMETGIPVIYGVLTTENFEQAMARSGGKTGHRGKDCVRAALEMMDLYGQIRSLSQ